MVKCDFSVYLIYLFDSQFCRIALAFSLVPLHQWKCEKNIYKHTSIILKPMLKPYVIRLMIYKN